MKNFYLILKILILIIFLSRLANAQYRGNNCSISLNYSYITTSKLFLSPNSSDIIARSQYVSLDNLSDFSIEIRYRIFGSILLGLNSELIKKTVSSRDVLVSTSSGVKRILVEDGFQIIPIEANIFYVLPFSTRNIKFFMAGGFGFYFGKLIRKFGIAKISKLKQDLAFGIQVSVGMDYLLSNSFSLRGQMRFRNPGFTITSEYQKRIVEYKGEQVALLRKTFTSKVGY